MFNLFRKEKPQDGIKIKDTLYPYGYIRSETYSSAVLKTRAEVAKIKASPSEKYYALAWGVFVDKNDKGNFFDSSCVPYHLAVMPFEGVYFKVEILGDKVVWISHIDIELPEIYISFWDNAGNGGSPYASINRQNKMNPNLVAGNALLVDFALGVFGSEIKDWRISELYDKEDNQNFWNAVQCRNPEIELSFNY